MKADIRCQCGKRLWVAKQSLDDYNFKLAAEVTPHVCEQPGAKEYEAEIEKLKTQITIYRDALKLLGGKK